MLFFFLLFILSDVQFLFLYTKKHKFFSVIRSSKTFTDIASRHMSDMTSSFKSKTEKFVSDIQSDLRQSKPILKHPIDSRTTDSEPRTYREESRVSEHGNIKKCYLFF